jgi:ADP-heptose:LPS heptosyltransferase
MAPLNISDRRERLLVRAADLALAPARLRRRRRPVERPQSIICFRLERIGDLLMTLPALAELHALVPAAAIDLVVGSWNAGIAQAIPGIRSVEVLDARWLARGTQGRTLKDLAVDARRWKSRDYDVAINFEPDIRSNVVTAAVGARWRAGFASGGGGPLLDLALPFDTTQHTADNMLALARAAAHGWSDAPLAPDFHLHLDDGVRRQAAERLADLRSPIVAMHVAGGRAIKQWPQERFAEVARWLAQERHASVVLTGATEDRAANALVRAAMRPADALDVAGASLVEAAAILERCDFLVTGDTGPMHLAHAVGTPVVAIFGPSDPRRYAPRGPRDRVVRIDLPCAPCNRIRQPPGRCVRALDAGNAPDCLSGVTVAAVLAAIDNAIAGLGADGDRIPTVA